MRLLIVAMSDSIHTTRWIKQVSDQGWDIHVFPCIDNGISHPEMKNVIIHHSAYSHQNTKDACIKLRGLPVFFKPLAIIARTLLHKVFPQYRAVQLARLIERLKPDVIHSLEIQHAGYLLLQAKNFSRSNFPVTIVTNWGSDIYLFGRLAEHREKIKSVLELADYYSCECRRDVELARQFGFKGKILPVFPNAGGFDLEAISKLRSTEATSERKKIMLKGYQGWAGRALVGLRALERCSDLLYGYKVVIFSPSPDVELAANLFTYSTGVPVDILQNGTSHNDIMMNHGCARFSIALSISDAISTSLLEAMVMGAFPIQSCTSCADEWIKDGQNGFLVPPEDPEIIEVAFRRALTEDNLVDQAAEINIRLAKERLDQIKITPKVIDFYNQTLKNNGLRHGN